MRRSDPQFELMLARERAASLRRSYAGGRLLPFRLSDLRLPRLHSRPTRLPPEPTRAAKPRPA